MVMTPHGQRSILNVSVKSKMHINNAALEQVFGNIRMAMEGTLQLGVREEYLTRYLALEYGVAGEALPEKRAFGAVASQVVIPKRPLRYSDMYRGKKTGYIVIRGTRGVRKLHQVPGQLPIQYTGTAPHPIVRPLIPQFRNMLNEIPERVLKQRYKGTWELKKGTTLKQDDKLRELYKAEMERFGQVILSKVQEKTPVGVFIPGRREQIERWNRNNPTEKRALGHLANEGYFIIFVERGNRNAG